MGVAERRELVRRAAEVERAGALQSGISTRLSGDRIFAVSPMKRTPATTSVARGMVAAEARHLERIGDAAAGFERQVLQSPST
jgi:hypothetical protein